MKGLLLMSDVAQTMCEDFPPLCTFKQDSLGYAQTGSRHRGYCL